MESRWGDGEVGELACERPQRDARLLPCSRSHGKGDRSRRAGSIRATSRALRVIVCIIVGRTKEMIIRSGFNVYPAEVEAVLNSHKDVVQSAVVGRSVAGNEEVVAFVQFLQGATTSAADLMAFVSPQLTSYKRPSEIIVLDSSTGNFNRENPQTQTRGVPAKRLIARQWRGILPENPMSDRENTFAKEKRDRGRDRRG